MIKIYRKKVQTLTYSGTVFGGIAKTHKAENQEVRENINRKIPISGLETGIFYWAQLDSNQRPMDYESLTRKNGSYNYLKLNNLWALIWQKYSN